MAMATGRKWRLLLLILGLILALGWIWARWIEPSIIVEETLDISLPGLPAALDGTTIAFVADLHVEEVGTRERRLVDRVRAADPDLVIVGGDFVQNAYEMADYMSHVARACSLVTEMPARHGRYGVFGNNDEPDLMRAPLARAGIHMLENEWVEVVLPGGTFRLIGLGDPSTGADDWERALTPAMPPGPRLAVAHSPDAFPEACRRGIEWLLCGHTHGGQVRHPLVGLDPERFLRLRRGTPPYRAGLYERDGCRCYVTRGVGMTHLPLRFLCPPELTLIRLRTG